MKAAVVALTQVSALAGKLELWETSITRSESDTIPEGWGSTPHALTISRLPAKKSEKSA
tara:strand:- start:513 stop:689 length:177 start_codon:yes stop_codon:yes gene_type:complete